MEAQRHRAAIWENAVGARPHRWASPSAAGATARELEEGSSRAAGPARPGSATSPTKRRPLRSSSGQRSLGAVAFS